VSQDVLLSVVIFDAAPSSPEGDWATKGRAVEKTEGERGRGRDSKGALLFQEKEKKDGKSS